MLLVRSLALVLLLLCSGCAQAWREYSNSRVGQDVPTMVTTADVRVITSRDNPRAPGNKIVCVEPPPDVAKALQASLGGGLAVDATGIGNGNIQVDYHTSEALAELTGRVPGLLALRDGLFRACEAYANGSIGDAAYALILSRYGDILTTVILADAVHDPSQRNHSSIGHINDNAPNHAAPGLTPTPPGAAAPKAEVAPGGDSNPLVGSLSWQDSAEPAAAVRLVGDPAAAGAAGGGTAPQEIGSVDGAAAAIAKLQENYLHRSAAASLAIACVSRFDASLPWSVSGHHLLPIDDLLDKPFCTQLMRGLAWANMATSVSELRVKEQTAGIKKLTEVPPFTP